MDTLIVMALVAIALIVVAVFFTITYSGKSGGNDNIWRPGGRNDPNLEG